MREQAETARGLLCVEIEGEEDPAGPTTEEPERKGGAKRGQADP